MNLEPAHLITLIGALTAAIVFLYKLEGSRAKERMDKQDIEITRLGIRADACERDRIKIESELGELRQMKKFVENCRVKSCPFDPTPHRESSRIVLRPAA